MSSGVSGSRSPGSSLPSGSNDSIFIAADRSPERRVRSDP
jgi:hypothetical protein